MESENILPIWRDEGKIYTKSAKNNNQQQCLKLKPWESGQRLKELPPPSREWIRDKIIRVATEGSDTAAFCSVLYLTGSRIRECIPYSYRHKDPVTNKMIKDRTVISGVKIKDIRIIYKNNQPNIFSITTRVEKIGRLGYKQCLVKMSEKNVYASLLDIIDLYIQNITKKSLIDFTDEDYRIFGDIELFHISYKTAKRVVKKVFGNEINCHTIRHWRIKHLVKYHNFNTAKLVKYIGWEKMETSLEYTRLTDAEMYESIDEGEDDE